MRNFSVILCKTVKGWNCFKWTKYYFQICLLLLFSGLMQSCTETADTQIRLPSTELYHQAMVSMEDEYYNEALKNFEILVEEHSGTRLATLAHLKMGDLYFIQNKWEEAETSYRQFLLLNPRSHLTPYTLNRLIALNYELNFYGVFFKSRDYDRNMEPNRKLIREYQRFYLLYPKSPYLADVKEYHGRAMSDLAEHELNVANYYFDKEAYHSAIGRYLYLLKNYPSFPRTVHVAERLIEAYRLNRQPELADEMQKVLDSLRERNLLAQHSSKEE
ncbi:MAG: Outer membrane protein assembly factor BamD [Deltaproteobacteria bacterium]|jgi:outer membrane protein assembly factor BamD|nr:Outer membrane protein assembly factor BamD [Deltaproteobacteria bacterium]